MTDGYAIDVFLSSDMHGHRRPVIVDVVDRGT
jgi:hypothetical protein